MKYTIKNIEVFFDSNRIVFTCLIICLWFVSSCEKEITINVPPSVEELVVEASINQLSPTLNYVVLSKTLDYFNPNLSFNAISGASVFITEGVISGSDTLYPEANRTQFFDVLDTIIPGVYVSATFMGKEETSYKLDIELTDGRKISGKTFIPKPSVFDSIHYWFEETSKDTNAYFFLQWFDGPEQNNYRMVLKKSFFPFLTGWGYGDRFYTFDDEIINNRERPFLMLNPYKYGDTVNIYLTQMGRNEYLFWDSFRNAANNGGPFATPVSVKSNVIGAIGSFTGYALTQEQLILR